MFHLVLYNCNVRDMGHDEFWGAPCVNVRGVSTGQGGRQRQPSGQVSVSLAVHSDEFCQISNRETSCCGKSGHE